MSGEAPTPADDGLDRVRAACDEVCRCLEAFADLLERVA